MDAEGLRWTQMPVSIYRTADNRNGNVRSKLAIPLWRRKNPGDAEVLQLRGNSEFKGATHNQTKRWPYKEASGTDKEKCRYGLTDWMAHGGFHGSAKIAAPTLNASRGHLFAILNLRPRTGNMTRNNQKLVHLEIAKGISIIMIMSFQRHRYGFQELQKLGKDKEILQY